MNAHWRAPAGLHVASARLPDEGELAWFEGATGWLNSPPLTPAGLRGKVVLAGFWTYTCINWLRQLPYLRDWAGKYSGLGLVVIGVHTPEFEFEKNVDNVRWAAKDMRVEYPIAIDSNYAVWRFQEQLLARPLFGRCEGADSTSTFRRGGIRTVGKDNSKVTDRSRGRRHRPRTRFGRRPRCGSCRRLGQLEVSEKHVGYERT